MLYHASTINGLKMLKPHISTHNKPYVYAIKSEIMAMLFGTEKDDFDLLIDVEKGKPVLYECYPNAIKQIYFGKKCSIYGVDEENFLNGITGWDEELVNINSVPVINEKIINNIYDEIIKAYNENKCKIHFYEKTKDYLSFIKDELQERVKEFGITEEQMDKDERFIKYHKKLLFENEL